MAASVQATKQCANQRLVITSIFQSPAGRLPHRQQYWTVNESTNKSIKAFPLRRSLPEHNPNGPSMALHCSRVVGWLSCYRAIQQGTSKRKDIVQWDLYRPLEQKPASTLGRAQGTKQNNWKSTRRYSNRLNSSLRPAPLAQHLPSITKASNN